MGLMMRNKILTIFPPGWVVNGPYLALPQLKGYADSLGENLEIYDDNILFFDHVFSEGFLLDKISYCETLFDNFKDKIELLSSSEVQRFHKLYRGLKYKSHYNNASKLKNLLRNSRNTEEYMGAYNTFACALDLVGSYYAMTISQNDIYSNKYTNRTIENLFDFTCDKKNNIFIDYYENSQLVEKCLSYDYVGISITSSSQMLSAFTLLSVLKRFDSTNKVKLFLGGNYLTRICENDNSNKMLSKILSKVDFISVFEGEPLMNNIFHSDFRYQDCANVIYLDKDSNCVVRNAITRDVYTRIPTIPNFDGFPLDKYFLPELVLPIMSSKNCYNNCAFCTIPRGTFGNKYIPFDIHVTAKNIKSLSEKYATKTFAFNDEVFALKRMLDFSKEVSTLGIDVKWLCETRFDNVLSVEEFQTIFSAGCRAIQFGLESHNQRILDLMKKNVDMDNIDIVIRNALKSGITVHLFCIFGFPTETENEVLNTKMYVLECIKDARTKYGLPLTSLGYGSFGLEKGSDVFNNPASYCVEIVEPDYDSYDYQYRYTVHTGISQERADEIVAEMSGGSGLTSKTYTPENFILCADSFSSNPVLFNNAIDDFVFINSFKFDPVTGVKLENQLYYYHDISSDIILSSEHDPNSLTAEEKGIWAHYGLFRCKRKMNLEYTDIVNVTVNPYLQIKQRDNGEYFVLDQVTKKTFTLSRGFTKIYRLMHSHGVQAFTCECIKQESLSKERLLKIINEFYADGFLILGISS